ncbi:hypothetical protein D5F01_LYC04695 [Larimichthys crocea]|uniref:Uncharacterized protein n=1 Tax=Larimichthys crocea TaxID=215358 RepID=A0A6G0IWP8_LARCR|nr:hypothetical protein D5F01_LYC04695 [Larimichthys crocea]
MEVQNLEPFHILLTVVLDLGQLPDSGQFHIPYVDSSNLEVQNLEAFHILAYHGNFGSVGLSNLFQATPRAPGQTPSERPPNHVSCGTRANNARGKEACHRPRVYGPPGNRPLPAYGLHSWGSQRSRRRWSYGPDRGIPRASMSSSAEQATRVVHPDSSGQPVQPPTPLKSTWQIRLEKEDMEEEEGVKEGEEETVVLAEEEEGIDMVVGEEVEIMEEEVEEERGPRQWWRRTGAWSEDFGSAFHPVHGHHPESAEDDFCPHPGLVGEAFGYGLGSAVICWCRHCNPGSVVEDAFNSDVQPVQLPTLQFPDEGWE